MLAAVNQRNTGSARRSRKMIRDFSIIGGLMLVVAAAYTVIHMGERSSQADSEGRPSATLMERVGQMDDLAQLIETGNRLMDSGRYDEAILHYSRALLLDSTLVDVRVDRGTSFFGLGRYHEAIADFTAAVNSQPDHVTAHFNLGIVYGALGRDSLAIAFWERCLELQPDGEVADRARQLLKQHGQ